MARSPARSTRSTGARAGKATVTSPRRSTRAIDTAKGLKSDLMFITDGQEAPPLAVVRRPRVRRQARRGAWPARRRRSATRCRRSRSSTIAATRSASGPSPTCRRKVASALPPPDAANRPGYEARNAPFGGEIVHGSEHLSSVRQTYLEGIAAKTGPRLRTSRRPWRSRPRRWRPRRRRIRPAAPSISAPSRARLALALLLAVYLFDPLRDRGSSRRAPPKKRGS